MSRFFAFGCSYTRYSYAPWADFVGSNFDYYCNYGRGGASNTYILNRFIEANSVHNFNKDDYIVVMFTGFGRYSYMPNRPDNTIDWVTNGDLYEYHHNTKDRVIKQFVDQIYSENSAIYSSWIAVQTIKEILLVKNIKHKFFMSVDNSHYLESDGSKWGRHYNIHNSMIQKTKEIYNLLNDQESVDEWKKNKYSNKDYVTWTDENNRIDHHPTQKMHFELMKEKLPEFNTVKSQNTFDQVSMLFKNDSQKVQGDRFLIEYQNLILKNII